MKSVFEPPHESMAWRGWGEALGYLPLWNTIILLSSSVTTFCPRRAENNKRKQLISWLIFTVLLGIVFIFLQAEEYSRGLS